MKRLDFTRMGKLATYGDTSKKQNKENLTNNIKELISVSKTLMEDIAQEDDADTSTEADFEYEKIKAEKFLDGMALRFVDGDGKPYLKKTKNKIIWGGVVNGIIRFIFVVQEDRNKSKVIFDYTEDFSPDNPENDEIIKKIEAYYNSFYDRWIDKIGN